MPPVVLRRHRRHQLAQQRRNLEAGCDWRLDLAGPGCGAYGCVAVALVTRGERRVEQDQFPGPTATLSQRAANSYYSFERRAVIGRSTSEPGSAISPQRKLTDASVTSSSVGRNKRSQFPKGGLAQLASWGHTRSALRPGAGNGGQPFRRPARGLGVLGGGAAALENGFWGESHLRPRQSLRPALRGGAARATIGACRAQGVES
jgi:hypothetical protein